jgi:hypothetical protein
MWALRSPETSVTDVFLYCLSVKIKALPSFVTTDFYHSTRCNIPEDLNPLCPTLPWSLMFFLLNVGIKLNGVILHCLNLDLTYQSVGGWYIHAWHHNKRRVTFYSSLHSSLLNVLNFEATHRFSYSSVTWLQLLRKQANTGTSTALTAETHWSTRTLPTDISLHSLTLPASEAGDFVELI